MTAASGDPGETPQNAGQQQPLGGYAAPLPGGYEAPPIEQAPPADQAYGSYTPPGQATPPAPGYQGYQTSQTSAGFPPPPPTGPYGQPSGGFPPPSYAPPSPPGYGGYPPPPPGYAPPAQYGPEYGTPYPGDFGYAAGAQGGTNTLAIISLVSSIVGLLCGIGSIIGIVCGAVALNQIKRTREGGHGLAIAGIVIGVASLVISVVVWMTLAGR